MSTSNPSTVWETNRLFAQALVVHMKGVSDAGVYRKEQWSVPLAACLLELRSCAHQQKQQKVTPPPGPSTPPTPPTPSNHPTPYPPPPCFLPYSVDGSKPLFRVRVCVGTHRVLLGAILSGGVSWRGPEEGHCTGCCGSPAEPHPPTLPPGLPEIFRWADHHTFRLILTFLL